MLSEDSPKINSPLLRQIAGHMAVLALKLVRSLPCDSRRFLGILNILLKFILPFYILIRRSHTQRIEKCFAQTPFHNRLSLNQYYKTRLRQLLIGLKQHGQAYRADAVRIEGVEHYHAALASGKPVLLLGLHSGLFELLHKVPEGPAGSKILAGRRFLILTAPAFAPALSNFMAHGRMKNGKEVLWNQGTASTSTSTSSPSSSSSSSSSSSTPLGISFFSGLKAVLQAKAILAMMVDQIPGSISNADCIHLWNRIHMAYPKRLLQKLIKQQACIIPISTRLEPDGTSLLKYHPRLGTNFEESLKGFLEQEIATAPEQWNWSYPKIQA